MDFSTRSLKGALAIHFIVFKLTLVNVAIGKFQYTIAMTFIIFPLSFKHISSSRFVYSMAIHFVIFPFSLINIPICILECPVSMYRTAFPFSFIDVSIFKIVNAITIENIIFPCAVIHNLTVNYQSPFPNPSIILEFSLVNISIYKFILSYAISLIVFELPFINITFFIFIYSVAVSFTIFELSFVYITIWKFQNSQSIHFIVFPLALVYLFSLFIFYGSKTIFFIVFPRPLIHISIRRVQDTMAISQIVSPLPDINIPIFEFKCVMAILSRNRFSILIICKSIFIRNLSNYQCFYRIFRANSLLSTRCEPTKTKTKVYLKSFAQIESRFRIKYFFAGQLEQDKKHWKIGKFLLLKSLTITQEMVIALAKFYKKLILLLILISICFSEILQNIVLRDEQLKVNMQKMENIGKLFEKVKSEKSEIFSKRGQVLIQINRKLEEVAVHSKKLTSTKIQAALAYRQYYTSLMKCDSLKSQIKRIDEGTPITHETCLQFPLSEQTNQIFVQYSQLSGFMNGSANAQRILDLQYNFVNDINITMQLVSDLMLWFKDKMNTTAGERRFRDAYARLDNLKIKLNLFYQNQQGLAQSKKMKADLESKIYLSTTLEIIRKEIALQEVKDACQKNMIKVKEKLNLKLSQAFELNKKLTQTKISLNKKYEQLQAFVPQLKQKTNELNTLVKQFAKYT